MLSVHEAVDLPPRILVNLYEQFQRREAARRLGAVIDLQAAIASAFGGDAARAVDDYKRSLEAFSKGQPEATAGYTSQQPPTDATPL
ncbi:hypothetical protein D3C71_328680 [compost metagenome]